MYKFADTIFALTRECRNDFLYNEIEVVPGYMFSQYQTIKKIHLYYNSHFVEGDYEEINGVIRKKPFYNISKWRCDVATKQIDLDTKDVVLVSNDMETDWNVFLLERELKTWLKRNKMGKVLNEISEKLPKYGSVVLRKIKGGAEVVDLRNFYCDQAAPNLQKSHYKILKHLMTPTELRAMKSVWIETEDGVQTVIDKFISNAPQEPYADGGGVNIVAGAPYAEIFEIYTEVPRSWITGKKEDDEDWTYSHWILAGVDSFQSDAVTGSVQNEDGIVLFKEELTIKEDPFREVHLNRTEGRWLGLGIIEDTFEPQRMRNRYANLEDKGMELATLILLHTTDQSIQKNILSDTENGDIMTSKQPVTRIDTRQYGLAEFNALKQDYDRLADRLSHSTDTLGGDIPPASATATSVVNAIQQATSTYDFKKENFGLFFQEFIDDLVFPELEKEIMKPHRFRFTGSPEETRKLRKYLVDAALNKASAEYFEETGNLYSDTELDRIREELMAKIEKGGRQIWIKVQERFFAGLDYYVDLVITGENRNIQAQLSNIQAVLTIVSRNPAILQDPVIRRVLFKMMSLIGIHISELEQIEEELKEQPQQQLNAAVAELGGTPQGAPPIQPVVTQ